MKKILLYMMILTATAMAWHTATVTKVVDGDTLWLQDGTKSFKGRLIGLDTFENKMNHRVFMQLATLNDIHPRDKHTVSDVLSIGHKTTRYVSKKYLRKQIKYKSFGKDKYDRELIYIDTLNYLLIRYGLAVQYPTNKLPKALKSHLLEASKEANLEQHGIYNRKKLWLDL